MLASLVAPLLDVGQDVINGGAGDDIIYGDVPNTDALLTAVNAVVDPDLPLVPGSGWLVFDALETGGPGMTSINLGGAPDPTPLDVWTRDDTVTYLRNNVAELSADGRGEPDIINGGAGDDTIIGQGGDDTLTGGSGADTFVYNLSNGSEGTDTITDFDLSDGDRLSFFDVVDIDGPPGLDATDLIASYSDGGSPGAVDTITLVNDTIINITDVDDAFSSAAEVFAKSIINGA